MQPIENASLAELFAIKNLEFKKSKFHEICSYIAMYPPELVHRLLNAYTKIGDEVYDPFSGRGTTLLEARYMQRKPYASDLSPLAYILTRAKSFKFTKQKIIKRIKKLEVEFANFKFVLDENDYQYMKTYFSPSAYKQLIFIKEKLGKNWQQLSDLDNLILAYCLGILHGPARKDGTSLYMSISMSNTNSMSKNYVDRYVRINQLVFPTNDNIFEKLIDKVNKTIRDDEKNSSYKKLLNGNVRLANALDCHRVFKNKKFDLILTSPPYLNIFNYTRENWIRFWLLGFAKNNISNTIRLDDAHRYESYKQFLIKFMHSSAKALKDTGRLILIIGDVENNYKFLNLWHEIESSVPFTLVDHYYDKRANKKSTRKNGTKAGKATKVDNICVFKRKNDGK